MIILIVVISLSILILVHELGHFLTAKFFGVRVDEFGIGFPPKLFGKKVGGTVYSVNLLPFGGFVKIFGEDGDSAKNSLLKDAAVSSQGGEPLGVSFVELPVWKRSLVILAGVIMNFVLGWLALSVVFMLGAPEHLAISGTAKDSPAFAANLKEGDVILWAAYGGEELKDPVKVLDFVALIKKAGAGEIDLKIQRGRENLVFSLNGRINPPAGQGSLGLSLAEIGFSKESFFRSLGKGAETAFLTFKLVALGFMNFISKIFVTPKIIETITGPVGIFTLATEAGALGGAYLLNLLALISINLAVLNLIPFPALDGGRFLFLIIEKIKGSPISKKVQIIVNTAGFAAFILLMIVVTVQDLGRIF